MGIEDPDVDVAEQGRPVDDADSDVDVDASAALDYPLEADAADVAEQAVDAGPAPHAVDRDLPLEAPEADALEQAQVVPFDEDERPA